MTGSGISVWILAARPKTLWAAAAPVFIGTAIAYRDGEMHGMAFALALIAAVFIQIGTNFYNDYKDFASGADRANRKGPTRAVAAGLATPAAMKRATIVAFSTAVVAGGYLMWRGGVPIVLIGASSILFGILYTAGRYSLANLGVADIFVFIFFGPVAVAGTYFVQALDWSAVSIAAGVAPGVLSIAILMVNNVRDMDEDRAHGKRTLVVRFGRSFGAAAYVGCVIVAAVVPVVLAVGFGGPPAAAAATVVLPLALPSIRRLVRTPMEEARRLNAVLATTGRLLLLYSLCFAAGWIFG